MSLTLDFAFFLPLIGSRVYTSVYLHGDRAALHQYINILTDEGGRMSDGSRGGCRRNQNVGIAKGM